MLLSQWLSNARGRGAALARHLHIPSSMVARMAAGNKQVPLDHCPFIQAFTANEVTCEELRPDAADYFALIRAQAGSVELSGFAPLHTGPKSRPPRPGPPQPVRRHRHRPPLAGRGGSSVTARSFLACAVLLRRDEGGVVRPYLAVDVLARPMARTPRRKLLCVEHHSDSHCSVPAQLLFRALGCRKPDGVGAKQTVSVVHEGLDCLVAVGLVPGKAGNGH
jgi:DNA-binding transcriptional regulator YdaS (Cro superfamily)